MRTKKLLAVIAVLSLLMPLRLAAQVMQVGVGSANSAAPAVPVTFTHIQSCAMSTNTATSPASCTFGQNIGTGHLLEACIGVGGADTIGAWSGDSGTFTSDLGAYVWYSTYNLSCFHVLSTGGGSATVSIACTPVCYQPTMFLDEWSSNYPFTFDKADTGNSSTGPNATSGSITPAVNGELIIGEEIQIAGSPSVGTNFSLGANTVANNAGLQEYLKQATAASIAATATINAGYAYGMHVVAIQ